MEPSAKFTVRENGDEGFENDKSTDRLIGSIVVDRPYVRARLDQHLKDVVAERFKMLGGDYVVAAEIERRTEIAVKIAVAEATTQIKTVANKLIEERIRKAVSELPINIRVVVDPAT